MNDYGKYGAAFFSPSVCAYLCKRDSLFSEFRPDAGYAIDSESGLAVPKMKTAEGGSATRSDVQMPVPFKERKPGPNFEE